MKDFTKQFPNGEQYQIVVDFLKKTKKKLKVLDVGAENKIIKLYGLNSNITYHSIDYTDKFGEQTYFMNLNEFPYKIPDNSYDVIVCLETLEHLLYPKKVIKELIRISKKEKSIFFLSLPNDYNLYRRILFLFNKKDWAEDKEPFLVVENRHHVYHPRIKDAFNLFHEFFNILEIRYIWYSNLINVKKKKYFMFIEDILKFLAPIFPTLFARLVVVRAILK